MKFFFDNNLSQKLVAGLRAFGENVIHLKDRFPENAPDADWLEYIGKRQIILVTRDERIRWNPAEVAAVRRYKVGAFVLGGKGLSKCRLIQQVIRNWPRIKDYATKSKRPFIYRVPPRGTKFSTMEL